MATTCQTERISSSGFAPRFVRTILAAAVCATVLAPAPAMAVASVIPVTTTADEVNTDGECSLRGAIVAANTNAAFDACPPAAARSPT